LRAGRWPHRQSQSAGSADQIGACDAFRETRASLYAQIDHTLARAASLAQDRQRGQTSLFGMFEESTPAASEPIQKLPEWPESELLAAEKELLGFYVTGHPLTPYMPIIEKYALSNTITAAQLPNRAMTRIGGMVTAVQQGISKRTNKPYAMVTLEDLQGTVQMLCMNENYDKFRSLLVTNLALLVVGEVNNAEDKPKIFPQEIMLLDEAPKRFTRQVHFRLQSDNLSLKALEAARDLALEHTGKCPLFLCIKKTSGETIFVETHERYFVTPSRELERATEALLGEQSYYVSVDATLPERNGRRWEDRQNGSGA
jgi:DNA polymerase III subunit alpha